MVLQTKGINNEKCKKKRAKNNRLLLYKNTAVGKRWEVINHKTIAAPPPHRAVARLSPPRRRGEWLALQIIVERGLRAPFSSTQLLSLVNSLASVKPIKLFVHNLCTAMLITYPLSTEGRWQGFDHRRGVDIHKAIKNLFLFFQQKSARKRYKLINFAHR